MKNKKRNAEMRGQDRSRISARLAALTIVDGILQSDKDTATEWMDRHFQRFAIPWRDRALITELVYGTLRRIITLDWILSHYTFHRVKDHLLKSILRLGVYQLYYLDRLPAYAVVHEMVQITKEKMGEAKARFVNAVLRRATARDVPVTEEGIAKLPDMDARRVLTLAYAMPDWLVERWENVYGQDQTRKICQASQATPPIFVRTNTRKIEPADLRVLLESEGVQMEPAEHPAMFRARPVKSFESLDSFRKGLFFVQDPTTLRIVDFLDLRPGEKVLDLCAAPGGKAFAMEAILQDGSGIVACEKNPARLRLAMENARRLGSNVRWMALDALPCPTGDNFDKILVDAPCSNQGVLARRVEVRWRLSREKIDRLGQIQEEILERALAWVQSTGVIFYSTCSIDSAENEDLVERFLKRHRGWCCPSKLTIIPEAGMHDGGFVAKLIRGSQGKKDGRKKSR